MSDNHITCMSDIPLEVIFNLNRDLNKIKKHTKEYDLTQFIKDRKRESYTSFCFMPLILICSDDKNFGGLKFDELENVKIIDEAEKLDYEDISKIHHNENKEKNHKDHPAIICTSIQDFPEEICYKDNLCDYYIQDRSHLIIFIIKNNVIVVKDKIHPDYIIIHNKINLKELLKESNKK